MEAIVAGMRAVHTNLQQDIEGEHTYATKKSGPAKNLPRASESYSPAFATQSAPHWEENAVGRTLKERARGK